MLKNTGKCWKILGNVRKYGEMLENIPESSGKKENIAAARRERERAERANANVSINNTE